MGGTCLHLPSYRDSLNPRHPSRSRFLKRINKAPSHRILILVLGLSWATQTEVGGGRCGEQSPKIRTSDASSHGGDVAVSEHINVVALGKQLMLGAWQ